MLKNAVLGEEPKKIETEQMYVATVLTKPEDLDAAVFGRESIGTLTLGNMAQDLGSDGDLPEIIFFQVMPHPLLKQVAWL